MSVKNAIYSNLKKRVCLGNTRRGFKEVASDLLHATGEKPTQIAKGTFLSRQTIERILDCEDNYRPQCETVERCLRYCNAEATFAGVEIQAKYANRPKD